MSAGFPNLKKLVSIALVLPVTTATVEKTFSDMKMVKTRLRSRLGEDTLDYALRICIEGQDTLDNDKLECIISHWETPKKPPHCFVFYYLFKIVGGGSQGSRRGSFP